MTVFKKVKQNRHFIAVILITILAGSIPLFGVYMDGMWYKYPFILGTYTISMICVIIANKWYLKKTM